MLRRALPRGRALAATTALTCAVFGLSATSAMATITPSLTLTPSGSAAGSTTQSLEVNLQFAPSAGDSPDNITAILPPGLLANGDLDGGACLASASPQAACQVASGTVTVATVPTTATAYLVAPTAGNLGGVALVEGASPGDTLLSTAELTLRQPSDPNGSGLDLVLTNLPDVLVDGLDLTFTDLRFPTSCGTDTVTVNANSYLDATNQTTNATFPVTGCSSLPYAPTFAAVAKKDSGDTGVAITTAVAQTSGQAASKQVELSTPTSTFSPNLAAVGEACSVTVTNPVDCPASATVGSVSATSPLLPVNLTGKVVLQDSGGTLPNLVLVFESPINLDLVGAIGIGSAADSVTLSNIPDIPLSSLIVSLSGGANSVFQTSCAAPTGTISGAFTPWSGTPAKTVPAALTISGCPSITPPPPNKVGKPTASGSLAGLPSGHPKVHVSVKQGSNAPKIAKVTIGLPSGLKFSSKAIKKHGTKVSGLSVSGGKLKTAKVSGGKLVITLKSAVSSVSVTAKGPLVTETKALKTKVKKHKVKKLSVGVKVTNAKGTSTSLSLKLKA